MSVSWQDPRLLAVLLEGGAARDLRTIARFADELEVGTVVPGHGPLASGEVLQAYRTYLAELDARVTDLGRAGGSLDTALAAFPLPDDYLPEVIDGPTRAFLEGLHEFNVRRVLQEARAPAVAGAGR